VAFTACFREHPFGDVEGTISREAVGCNSMFGGDAGRNL
jgi:hypothetical protein